MTVHRALIVAFSLVLSGQLLEAVTPREIFTATLTREQSARVLLAGDDSAAALAEIREIVVIYQTIVRQYPTSEYADDSLWQAGRLALDAFERFGQARDKTTGTRLLKLLVGGYPGSKHIKVATDLLARVDAEPPSQRSQKASPPASEPTAQRSRKASPAGSEPTAQRSPKTPSGSEPTDQRSQQPTPSASEPIDQRSQKPTASAPASRPPPNDARATIKEIRRALLPDVVRVIVELDAEAPFHHERLTGPARVFVDIASTRPAPTLLDQTLRFEADRDLVRQIRIGRHPNSTTRVVLETAGIVSYSVYALRQPYRIIIDCVRPPAPGTPPPERSQRVGQAPPPVAAEIAPSTGAGRVSARATVANWTNTLPIARAPDTAAIAAALAMNTVPAVDRPSDRAVIAVPTPISPPTRPKGSPEVSISRQLGLSVSRIVIDPGHGGHDPGALGKGINEAELVLDVALRLERLLLKSPGTEVILTRRTDAFVPLQERTAIANREGADLFLSIHANASPNANARGVETYFLSFANNLNAAAVAARENAASGQAMGALPDFVKAIALSDKLAESRDLATDVQRALVERLRGSNKSVRDLGVKQAPFLVLIGAAMPSVLAEISFITNPQESKLLRGGAYRQRIAEALFNAIRKYQSSLTAKEVRVANRRSS
jgi:N-acetylmuramoyl-L-alanine amidase